MIFARVVFSVPLNQYFDYIVPEHVTPIVGARVKAPFGSRMAIGIITEVTQQTHLSLEQLKTLDQQLDNQPLFSLSLWQLLHWAADYYHYPLGEVLFHALPVLLRQGKPAYKKPLFQWQITELGLSIDLASLKGAHKQKQVLSLLRQQNWYHYQLTEQGISLTTLRTLQNKNWVKSIACRPENERWQQKEISQKEALKLTKEQAVAVSAICSQSTQFHTWLLEGITGSGKTEVYLQTLKHILSSGKQALVLVPEIGLTPQTISRFRERFNATVDILHSNLNNNERLAVWLRAKSNETAIVIGTRSALFTPFQQLGIIIVDEEHDTSYKQQEGWHYQARDVAIKRAHLENIPIILGSATPALESLNNALIGKYHHLKLTYRPGQASTPTQLIIDLKGQKLKSGLSAFLLTKIEQHLSANNQVLLFLNRRGFSPALLCHECGWIAECPYCERYYTLHQNQQRLRCHHCDSQRLIPHQCPQCGSTNMMPVGVGTEQLDVMLRQQFPHTPITRIDRDTTQKKGALEQHLAEINHGGARILIGTQMLAKGHHFPDVTLVALIDVDGALFSADFRATERFAQLYTQVAGRAGRANKPGEIILQTHHPENPLLNNLLQHGYNLFAQQSLQERKMIPLPPFAHHVLFRAEDYQSDNGQLFLQQLSELILPFQQKDADLRLLGPIEAPLQKKGNRYRWQLLIQHVSRTKLQQLLKEIQPKIEHIPLIKKVRWTLDVDPMEYS